jgi:hypothetical protein
MKNITIPDQVAKKGQNMDALLYEKQMKISNLNADFIYRNLHRN